MLKEELIKDIKPNKPLLFWSKKILNKYVIAILAFLVWMTFFDNSSFLVLKELSEEENKIKDQLSFYQNEYEKNNNIYQKLMNNKEEREKFARENYFMKKREEEIFILVVDTLSKHKK